MIFLISRNLIQINRGSIYYVNFSCDNFKLGGSAFSQIIGDIGNETPSINDTKYFLNAFEQFKF